MRVSAHWRAVPAPSTRWVTCSPNPSRLSKIWTMPVRDPCVGPGHASDPLGRIVGGYRHWRDRLSGCSATARFDPAAGPDHGDRAALRSPGAGRPAPEGACPGEASVRTGPVAGRVGTAGPGGVRLSSGRRFTGPAAVGGSIHGGRATRGPGKRAGGSAAPAAGGHRAAETLTSGFFRSSMRRISVIRVCTVH
jgi:hypothetical protein